MQILITGAAGFIGSHLCDRLLSEGHGIVGVDNLLTGSLENLAHIQQPNFNLIQHDISEPLDLSGPFDWIVHLASPASPMDYLNHPIETLRVGAEGTRRVLDLARASRAKFLLASTSEVYGDPLVHPQPEEYWGNVNPIGPRAVYDEAKRYAEAITMAYRRRYGLPVRIARIFNTFGERNRLDDGRAVPTFITQALKGEPLTVFGDGTQTRSFCYVSDLVEGLRLLMGSEEQDPINLGNPEEMQVIAIAREIIEVTRSRSRIVFRPLPQDDPKRRRPDISRARRILGWAPKVPLEEGLRKTAEDFRRRLGAVRRP